MGYTVATPIKNPKLRDQVIAFLDEEFRTWPQLHGKNRDAPMYISLPHPDGKGRYEPKSARNLDYDSGKCRIGFNFNACEYERDYAFTVCKWMALRWGRHRKFAGFPMSCPHIVYDGYEAWPIFVRGQWDGLSKELREKWDRHDEWGCRFPTKYDQRTFKFIRGEKDRFTAAFGTMRTELKRLDAAWAAKFGERPRVWRPPADGVTVRA